MPPFEKAGFAALALFSGYPKGVAPFQSQKKTAPHDAEPPEIAMNAMYLEIPREAQLDDMVAGIVVALDLVVFVADHEVRALGHAELEAGLGRPGKFGGGNGAGPTAVFQTVDSGFHITVSGARLAAQVEHGVVADGQVQGIAGHHRNVRGTEAGGVGAADAQVVNAGMVGAGQNAAVQGNLVNNAACFNVVENAQIAAGHIGHGVLGGNAVGPFQGHAELAVIFFNMIRVCGGYGGRKGQT